MKPRLLDLFSGAGGCARGYQLAGFHVTGVDIEPQPRYAGDVFIQADALEFLEFPGRFVWPPGGAFDAIHASPPCQSYSSALKHLSGPKPALLDPVRRLLVATGLPWVLENVVGAPLPRQDTLDGRHGLELCGTMFGLRTRRHRLFETSFSVIPPRPCDHRQPALNPYNQLGRDRIYAEFGRQNPETLFNREMGVGWMTGPEGQEAVPPAMTEHIGTQLLAHIEANKVAA